MSEGSKHSRQRRAPPEQRGWYSTREYAQRSGRPWSTVKLWCAQGRVPHPSGLGWIAVAGGNGRDYRIPLAALDTNAGLVFAPCEPR
jgi:hypothetical protein